MTFLLPWVDRATLGPRAHPRFGNLWVRFISPTGDWSPSTNFQTSSVWQRPGLIWKRRDLRNREGGNTVPLPFLINDIFTVVHVEWLRIRRRRSLFHGSDYSTLSWDSLSRIYHYNWRVFNYVHKPLTIDIIYISIMIWYSTIYLQGFFIVLDVVFSILSKILPMTFEISL